jgi:dUTP pyrophosphatase
LDYYNNDDNEGHIMVPMINLSPFDVIIKKGDKIAQALIKNYYTIDDEEANQATRNGGFGSTDKESDN